MFGTTEALYRDDGEPGRLGEEASVREVVRSSIAESGFDGVNSRWAST